MMQGPGRRWRYLALIVTTAVALALAGIGLSTPPGRNGLIAFSFDGRGAGTALRGKPPGIAVVRPDGSGARLLIRNGRSPAWSPDGRRLAFIRSGNVFVMNANGRGVQRLTSRRTDDSPAWSPDGRRIAFVRALGEGDSQRGALMVMNADGHHRRAVYFSSISEGVAFEGPSWSPDGTLIAFSKISGQLGEILVVAQIGSRAWSPASGENDDYDPDWSPDGKYLAFTRTVWLCGSCDVDGVWLLTRADAEATTHQLIDEAANPSWAPDGKLIVAEGRSPDGLIIIDLDGNSRPLFPYSGTEPAWQPVSS